MIAILEKNFLKIFTQLVPLCTIMNYLFKNIDGCTKGPTAFSAPPPGNYAERIAMIYPKYHFPLLADLWIQF